MNYIFRYFGCHLYFDAWQFLALSFKLSFLLTSAKICTQSLHPADRYASAPYGRLQKSGLDRYTKQEINKDPDLMDMQKRSQRSPVGNSCALICSCDRFSWTWARIARQVGSRRICLGQMQDRTVSRWPRDSGARMSNSCKVARTSVFVPVFQR